MGCANFFDVWWLISIPVHGMFMEWYFFPKDICFLYDSLAGPCLTFPVGVRASTVEVCLQPCLGLWFLCEMCRLRNAQVGAAMPVPGAVRSLVLGGARSLGLVIPVRTHSCATQRIAQTGRHPAWGVLIPAPPILKGTGCWASDRLMATPGPTQGHSDGAETAIQRLGRSEPLTVLQQQASGLGRMRMGWRVQEGEGVFLIRPTLDPLTGVSHVGSIYLPIE